MRSSVANDAAEPEDDAYVARSSLRWPRGERDCAAIRPGLASHALLKADEPNAYLIPFCGSVKDPDLKRLADVGDPRLALDDAVCLSVGRLIGVVGYAGERAEVRVDGVL